MSKNIDRRLFQKKKKIDTVTKEEKGLILFEEKPGGSRGISRYMKTGGKAQGAKSKDNTGAALSGTVLSEEGGETTGKLVGEDTDEEGGHVSKREKKGEVEGRFFWTEERLFGRTSLGVTLMNRKKGGSGK